jgi:pyruvate/2-oxoglutarate dehydrogenase complex dihydrolipoamide dehydrogenase (E3) component
LFDFNYRTNLPNIFYWLTQNSVTDYLHQLAEQSTSAYPSIKSIDIDAVRKNKDDIVSKLTSGIKALAKARGVHRLSP